MKAIRNGLVVLLVIFMTVVSGFAYADNHSGEYQYKVSKDGSAVITKYMGNNKEIVVPDHIDGYEVIAIEDNAFYKTSAEKIVLPSTILTIGEYAFGFAKDLKEVSTYATKIEKNAFTNCSDLEKVELLAETTKVEDQGFYKCSSLESISGVILDPESYAFGFCDDLISVTISGKSVADNAFTNCGGLESITILGDGMKMESQAFYKCDGLVTITGVVLDPDSYSFGFCKKLASVSIGGESVSDNAFTNCGDLETVIFVNDGIEIESQAFYKCDKLKTVTGNLGNVESYAFGFDKKLESITIIGSEVGDNAFTNCSKLKSVTFLTPLVEINDQAFYKCEDLENVDGIVGNIGSYAFGFCKDLQSLTFAGTDIENNAFQSCSKLTVVVSNSAESKKAIESAGVYYTVADIVIPEVASETAIEEKTVSENTHVEATPAEETIASNEQSSNRETYVYNDIEYCILDDDSIEITKYNGKASSLTIPNTIDGHTVTHIGVNAFKDCTKLKSIDMAESIVSIGASAFEGCTKLEKIYYMSRSSIAYIGERAFMGCTSLEDIDIPEDLTAILDSTFEGCSDMRKAYYMSSSAVEIIGKNAFKDCKSLEDIDIPKKTTIISEAAFMGCSNLDKAYYLGSSAVSVIDKYAFKGCSDLEDFDAPQKLKEIRESAFEGCTKLEHIYYLDEKKVTFGVNAFANCPNLDNKPKGALEDITKLTSSVDDTGAVSQTTEEPITTSPAPASTDEWICTSCGNNATGKFCNNCGAAKPDSTSQDNMETEQTISPTPNPTEEPKPESQKSTSDSLSDSDEFKQNLDYFFSPIKATVLSIIPMGDDTFTVMLSNGQSYTGYTMASDGSYSIQCSNFNSSNYDSIESPYDYKDERFRKLLNYLMRNDGKTITSIIPMFGDIYTAQDSDGNSYMISILCSESTLMVGLLGM